MCGLCLAPLTELVRLYSGHPTVAQLPPGRSHTKTMKAGGADPAVLLVVKLYPTIEFLDHVKVVDKVGWRGVIALEPDQLRRVDDCGDDHLVLSMWVLGVLGVDQLFKSNKAPNHGGHIGAPDQVIEAHGDEHAHGPGLVLVVDIVRMRQVRDCATRHSYPVYMNRVRGASNGGIPRKVKVVQLAITKANIKASWWAGGVCGHTGGAKVRGVSWSEFHPLDNAHLLG